MIYFIRVGENGKIEIGTTLCLTTRLKQHESDFRCDLIVLGVMDGGREMESQVHRQFSHLRCSGRELFNGTEELLLYIEKRCRMPDLFDGLHERTGTRTGADPGSKITRIQGRILSMARFIASARGVSVCSYLSSILEDKVESDFLDEARRLDHFLEATEDKTLE